MRGVFGAVVILSVIWWAGLAGADAPLLTCAGLECGGSGPRQYAYEVDAASFPILEFTVGTNDLNRRHYTDVLIPDGWRFTVEAEPMNHLHGIATPHGRVSNGPCRCLTAGRVRWWTDDPKYAVEIFTFGYNHPAPAEDVAWILTTQRPGELPRIFQANWDSAVGGPYGPMHGPRACPYYYDDDFSTRKAVVDSFDHSVFWPELAFPPAEPYLFYTSAIPPAGGLAFAGYGQDDAHLTYYIPGLPSGPRSFAGTLALAVFDLDGGKLQYLLSSDGRTWTDPVDLGMGYQEISLNSDKAVYVRLRGRDVVIDDLCVAMGGATGMVRPRPGVCFSTNRSFVAQAGPHAGQTIGSGDLLSPCGVVVAGNSHLIRNFGPEPIPPDYGLDAVYLCGRAAVLFSLDEGFWDERLATWVGPGDLLSDAGVIVRTNADLLKRFHPMPPLPTDLGLDALHVRALPREVWFSIEGEFLDEALGVTVGRGDLLSDAGRIVKTNAELLRNFHPMPGVGDYGLDAVHVLPSGEILFSIEEGFFDEVQSLWVDAGDLLSDRGKVLATSAQLLSGFFGGEDEVPEGLGLDAIAVRWGLAADADLDGRVDLADFAALSTNFGKTGACWTDGDFTGDGTVNLTDFAALSTSYGAEEDLASSDAAPTPTKAVVSAKADDGESGVPGTACLLTGFVMLLALGAGVFWLEARER